MTLINKIAPNIKLIFLNDYDNLLIYLNLPM